MKAWMTRVPHHYSQSRSFGAIISRREIWVRRQSSWKNGVYVRLFERGEILMDFPKDALLPILSGRLDHSAAEVFAMHFSLVLAQRSNLKQLTHQTYLLWWQRYLSCKLVWFCSGLTYLKTRSSKMGIWCVPSYFSRCPRRYISVPSPSQQPQPAKAFQHKVSLYD